MADIPGRWSHVSKLLERAGPLAHPEFQPNPELLTFMQESCRILVIGAGGLGCELLKDLVYMGFRNIDVIDMDTIDLSNLNRQFLFRRKDIDKPKADVAAEFINSRIQGANITPHCAKIQDYDADFYKQFHMVVCGLDSIIARRWINGMLISLLNYEDGELDQTSMIPMVDGGTEGFKGNARVILPGITACVECTLDLYPPQVNFPMCTIAHTPRMPEHCTEYAKVFLWPQDKPFGEGIPIDGDNPDHIKWLYDRSVERANQFGITGVTVRLTQGVIKRIIPAVASTNAVIAAACATEVFKIATYCSHPLSNYMTFNDTEGIYTYTFEAEKRDDCPACSQIPQHLTLSEDAKLQEVIDYLKESSQYQFTSPGIVTNIGGQNKTLYMNTVKSIEEATKPNLKKTLKELGLLDGHEIYVADPTTPTSLTFRLQLASKMDD